MDEAADIVIVGAGSAGCVLAARLSEDPSRHVVLIEAGGETQSMHVRLPSQWPLLWDDAENWGYATTLQAGFALRSGGGHLATHFSWKRGAAGGQIGRVPMAYRDRDAGLWGIDDCCIPCGVDGGAGVQAAYASRFRARQLVFYPD